LKVVEGGRKLWRRSKALEEVEGSGGSTARSSGGSWRLWRLEGSGGSEALEDRSPEYSKKLWRRLWRPRGIT
jgi:hypothetical protein